MEQELNLNDNSCVSLSPNSVLPFHQYCFNVKNNKKACRNEKFKEDFTEVNSSCKRFSCKSHRLEEGNLEKRRGSIYQSSYQVINTKKMVTMEQREKIEISSRTNSDASFSGSIFYSLCGSNDEGFVKRPSIIYQDSELSSQSPSGSDFWTYLDHNISNGFIELCINADVCDEKSSLVEGVGSVNSKIKSDKVTNSPLQKHIVHGLQRSIPTKVEISHSKSYLPYPLESDCSSRVSSKVSFTPIRKRLNPFTKSKKVTRNMACQKSLLNDFSNTSNNADIVSEFVNRDIQHSSQTCSPVHMHGNLKLKNKQGLPYFEFKVNSLKDVFVAKTWRVGNAFNWVYTFHSFDTTKKNKDSSSMVAQMLVSYSLCSELENGVLINYMVTEFVLYDFTPSRKSVTPEKTSYSKQDDSKTLNASSLESAAIVLRIPFHKRESLKYKRGDRISAKTYSKVPSDIYSEVEKNRNNILGSKFLEQVKVVLPIGNHGLPSAESEGPSSLLDRWKHGGGCDCGGWDMACPLILLGNPSIQIDEDCPIVKKYQPLELFSQGTKENTPTFGMTLVEEGQYAVDFHAKLSPLQAFSISVAILHGTSAFSGSAGQAKNQQLSQCTSLSTLIEEEVDFFIKSVTTEQKAMSEMQKRIPLSCVLNPPFSPIGRV